MRNRPPEQYQERQSAAAMQQSSPERRAQRYRLGRLPRNGIGSSIFQTKELKVFGPKLSQVIVKSPVANKQMMLWARL
jgi:hypothetical protein